MRILLVGHVDVSLPGGLETHLRELATALGARGHEVAVLGRPASLPPLTMVDRLDPSRWDVLHHHAGPWPRALDRHRGLVRTFHFATAAKMRVYLGLGRLKTLANLPNWRAIAGERASARRAGPLVAVSARLREELIREYAFDPARVHVVPNGVRLPAPTVGRAAWRARWGIAPDARVLLTIGRADFVKGYDLLARAWRAADPPRDAVWVTVGGASESRAPGRLVTGPASHAEVSEWIAAADVGALPSYYEGGGIALLEMLAGGLRVLSHDVGVAREVIREGENGTLLARDPHAWSTALTHALTSAPTTPVPPLPRDYTWPAIAERLEGLYASALE